MSAAGGSAVGSKGSFFGVLWNLKNGEGLYRFFDTLGLFEREQRDSN